MVLCSETIAPLAIVQAYPIGVMAMIDGGAFDYKIIAVPFQDPTYNTYREVGELPPHIVQEIAHFFNVYKQLEHKETTVMEILGRDRAIEIIKEALDLYREKFGSAFRS